MSRFNSRNGGFLTCAVTVRLDENRFAQLEKIADREGFPSTVIVRHLIHRYLEQESRLNVTNQHMSCHHGKA